MALPLEWAEHVRQARIVAEAPLPLLTYEGHRPGGVVTAVPSGKQPARPKSWYCRRALKIPEVQALVGHLWTSTPALPPTSTADDMQACIAKLGRTILAEACPPEKPAPRREWLSGDGLHRLRDKAAVLRALHQTGRAIRTCSLRFFFAVWSGAAGADHRSSSGLSAASDVEAALHTRRAFAGALLARLTSA